VDNEDWTDAGKELARAWFAAFEDLYSTVMLSESTADRIRAAEVILNYCVALGQSINTPYMPQSRPPEDEDAEEDDND
jgi:hypothetical protein